MKTSKALARAVRTPPASRRDRLRSMLADLSMPGALEALDSILQGIDSGTLTAAEALEALLSAQIELRNARRLEAAMRPRAGCRRSRRSRSSTSRSSPRSNASRSRVCTSWAFSNAGRT